MLVAEGAGVYRPVLVNGCLVRVRDRKLIKDVLQLAPKSFRAIEPPSRKLPAAVDDAKLLSAVRRGGWDEH